MLIDYDGRITRDVTGNLFLSLLIDETAETANVDVVAISHIRFHNVKKCFYGGRNICFVNSGFFCDLINYVCFGHGCIVYILLELLFNFRDGKFKRSLLKRKMNLLIITHMEVHH